MFSTMKTCFVKRVEGFLGCLQPGLLRQSTEREAQLIIQEEVSEGADPLSIYWEPASNVPKPHTQVPCPTLISHSPIESSFPITTKPSSTSVEPPRQPHGRRPRSIDLGLLGLEPAIISFLLHIGIPILF
jgi:hypothetical protein